MGFHSQRGCWALTGSTRGLFGPIVQQEDNEPEDDEDDDGGERECAAFEDRGTDADDEDAPLTYFEDNGPEDYDTDGVDGGDDE